MRIRETAVSLLLTALLAASGAAQAGTAGQAQGSARVTAVRASAAPAIDGRGDDATWASAPKISDFRQFQPVEDGAPSFRTEFQVAYDDHNLYVFVRAHDPHPDSILRSLTRRDQRGPSDQIAVIIDSYDDNRSGFDFNVNPDGVKRDYAISNDGNEDASWNGIWDVATVVDAEGWAAEFRIPLSQLRFADAPTHTFGLGVWRDIERYKERVSWPLYRPSRQGFVSQMGSLDGIDGVGSSSSLEVTPYTVAKSVTRAQTAGGFDHAQKIAIGGDLKYGITPNVTLDATVNPDFGQVEADPATLNLSAFETFLSERRPFFVEGTGLYRFQINCYAVVDCNTNEGLFYSRRIGRAPLLLNAYGEPSTPTATPIAAAAKLTGRTGSGLSFGMLDAVTLGVEGSDERTVEPRTNYAVLRAKQDLRNGRADVSVIGTAVNRALDDWTSPFMHRDAYAGGASFRNRFGDTDYELEGSFMASRVGGSAEAITRTQMNAVHYFQQPGLDLDLDSARTSLTGTAAEIKLGKFGGGITRFQTSYVRQSSGFDVNDLGYLRRADRQDWSTWAALNFNTPRWIYRTLRINGNHWETWNTDGLRLDNAWNTNVHMDLDNNWNVHAGATAGSLGESWCDRCTRGGPALRISPGLFPWFGVNGDDRMFAVPSMWVNLSYGDEGKSHGYSLSPSVDFRVSTRLQASVGANISHDTNDTQWFDNIVDEDGTTHYTFARLDQRTVSMNLRVNYTARPNLTFELYGEPFASDGTYTSFRELSATPDADDYDARYADYTPMTGERRGFNVQQLRTNAVMRYEYRPGSTLFLVWAHGRQAERFGPVSPHGRTWHEDYRDLLDLHPDNT
ncbi:MAG TPA: DUF5916 domain-containing protein, partial [Longimicrobiales bacterium]